MTRSLIILLCLNLLFGIALASNGDDQVEPYRFSIDLRAVENDRLKVELIPPAIVQKEIIYYMPKIVPGTYSVADFGQFVSEFEAYSKKGKKLKVERLDDNSWKISKAHKLGKITYWVDDVYDHEQAGKGVLLLSGNNIEKDEVFVINPSGYFGYFDGKKEQPYEVSISRPGDFYGSTGLIATERKEVEDVYEIDNYHFLVDAPLMYSRPDTAVIKVADTDVLISVFSPNGKVQAKYLANVLEDLLKAQEAYLGGELPVKKYAFLMYFADLNNAAPMNGALEHSYSSYYYFHEYPQEQIAQYIREISAHEFFHIVTPLGIHSEEIHYFDYNKPKMSRHLWLYEGVTEYAAHHSQVQYGLTKPEVFLEAMRGKIATSRGQFQDELPFTELSLGSLDKHADQYLNVYQKGALIGMCLDIQLLKLSKGTFDLQDLIKKLGDTYGKDRAFKDEELFEEIARLSYPETKDFLEKYVAGSSPLPIRDLLKEVGIAYEAERKIKKLSLGQIGIGYNPETKRLVVVNTDNMNSFGQAMSYQAGDEISLIGGQKPDLANLEAQIQGILEGVGVGKNLEMVVLRKNESEEYEEEILSAPLIEVDAVEEHILEVDDEATAEQLALRRKWLGGE